MPRLGSRLIIRRFPDEYRQDVLVGGLPAERWGRKQALFWVGVLYLACSLGCASAQSVELLMCFRFLGGLGVGASSVSFRRSHSGAQQ